MRRIRIAWMTISDPSSRSTETNSRKFPARSGPRYRTLPFVWVGSYDRMCKGVLDAVAAAFMIFGVTDRSPSREYRITKLRLWVWGPRVDRDRGDSGRWRAGRHSFCQVLGSAPASGINMRYLSAVSPIRASSSSWR